MICLVSLLFGLLVVWLVCWLDSLFVGWLVEWFWFWLDSMLFWLVWCLIGCCFLFGFFIWADVLLGGLLLIWWFVYLLFFDLLICWFVGWFIFLVIRLCGWVVVIVWVTGWLGVDWMIDWLILAQGDVFGQYTEWAGRELFHDFLLHLQRNH